MCLSLHQAVIPITGTLEDHFTTRSCLQRIRLGPSMDRERFRTRSLWVFRGATVCVSIEATIVWPHLRSLWDTIQASSQRMKTLWTNSCSSKCVSGERPRSWLILYLLGFWHRNRSSTSTLPQLFVNLADLIVSHETASLRKRMDIRVLNKRAIAFKKSSLRFTHLFFMPLI